MERELQAWKHSACSVLVLMYKNVNKWKLLDYRKVDMKAKQPLSIYYKLGALLILPVWRQGNQIGEYFNM